MELKSALKLATVLWGTTEGNRCTILEAAALIRADRLAVIERCISAGRKWGGWNE